MLNFKVTKETMEQYETIRRLGVTNMFNYYNVINVAKKIGLKKISKLTLEQYKNILMNFGKYMKQFDIKQN